MRQNHNSTPIRIDRVGPPFSSPTKPQEGGTGGQSYDSVPSTPRKQSKINPIFGLDKDMNLTIDTRYVEAVSSTGKKSYVVFNGPVKGTFYNWNSADLSIRAMNKKGVSYKGFEEISEAHKAWDRFLRLGNDGLPQGLPIITQADVRLAETVADNLRQNLGSATSTANSAHFEFGVGPYSQQDGDIGFPLSPYTRQDRKTHVVQPTMPARLFHEAGTSPTINRVGAATSSTPPLYVVVLAGERPGVYTATDEDLPLTEKSEIVDTLAAANQRFVTAYMSNSVERTYKVD